MKHPSPLAQTAMRSMKQSVEEALERKHRLGQYAVVSRNGKLVRLLPEEIQPRAVAEGKAAYNPE